MKELEIRLTRKKLLQTIIFSVGAVALGFGAKSSVEFLNDVMTPQYVVNGSSSNTIPEEQPIWQPRTDWKRK